jgi:GABA permease
MMGSEVATIAAVESSRPAENIARAVRTVALRILIF